MAKKPQLLIFKVTTKKDDLEGECLVGLSDYPDKEELCRRWMLHHFLKHGWTVKAIQRIPGEPPLGELVALLPHKPGVYDDV